jgi:murein DD-endopeptidase MepM/ murein hydrolase activator NlpD
VRLPDVDQGQHHENKGLQRNDQNVEDGPNRASNDVTNGQQNAAQAQQATEAYNAKQTAIESVLNAQQTIPISNLSAPETGPALAYKGAVVTSAKDTSGEPGFDFVIPGGRGAVFKAPFNAQVLKVVGDQNWETHLEQGSGQRGYGNYVDIRAKTPEGRAFDVRLAHFDAINPALKPGMVIGPGTAIGKQGRTGSTTGPHVSWDMYDPNKNTTSPDLLRLRDQFAARISRGQPIL